LTRLLFISRLVKSFVKNERLDFDKVSDVGHTINISYDKMGKAIIVDVSTVKLKHGLSH
jgi:hypothetical protein